MLQTTLYTHHNKKENKNSNLRNKHRNKFKAQASLVGAHESSEKDSIREAKKMWELGKQLGLVAEDESEVAAYLAKSGKAKKGGLKQTRRKMYKGVCIECCGMPLVFVLFFLGIPSCGLGVLLFMSNVWEALSCSLRSLHRVVWYISSVCPFLFGALLRVVLVFCRWCLMSRFLF